MDGDKERPRCPSKSIRVFDLVVTAEPNAYVLMCRKCLFCFVSFSYNMPPLKFSLGELNIMVLSQSFRVPCTN